MAGPRAKYRAADTHMAGAMGNRQLVVGTHPHAQTVNAVAPGNLSQQIEMRRGVLLRGRDAHEPGNPQTVFIPAALNEGISLLRQRAGLLLFLPGVHLQKQIRITPLVCNFLCQNPRQLWSVNGVDGIKQRHRITRLVGLQWADKVQRDIVIGLLQLRPLLLRFLHTVLAEDALPRIKDRCNRLSRKCLAHSHERDRRRTTLGPSGRLINPDTDRVKSGGLMLCGVTAHG